eukprot:3324684-Pyramimonas_sp.AAC.1
MERPSQPLGPAGTPSRATAPRPAQKPVAAPFLRTTSWQARFINFACAAPAACALLLLATLRTRALCAVLPRTGRLFTA